MWTTLLRLHLQVDAAWNLPVFSDVDLEKGPRLDSATKIL